MTKTYQGQIGLGGAVERRQRKQLVSSVEATMKAQRTHHIGAHAIVSQACVQGAVWAEHALEERQVAVHEKVGIASNSVCWERNG